jgi:hypothetical protein
MNAADDRRPGTWWALRTWPAAWRAAYGEEMHHTWAASGGRRAAAVGIALLGIRKSVARSRPAISGRLAVEGGVVPASSFWRGPGALLVVALTAVELATVLLLHAAALETWKPLAGVPTPVLEAVSIACWLVPFPIVVCGDRMRERRPTLGRGLVHGGVWMFVAMILFVQWNMLWGP